MAITTARSNNVLTEFATGAQLTTDTYKAVLIKTGHTGTYGASFVTAGTPGTGTPTSTNIGTDEVSGSGYTSGGITLGAPTIATIGGKTVIDFPSPAALSNCTFSADGLVIINTTRSNKVVGCVSFGSAKAPSAASFTLTFPAQGALTSLFRAPN